MHRGNRGGRLIAAAACSLLVTALAACGSKPATPQPPQGEQIDFAHQLENFEAAKFSNPTKVTNTWMPLAPGNQRIYDGTAEEEPGKVLKRRFVETVTDLTKPILGVRTVVVWQQDFENDELTEAELAFFAQADDGDVWYFGEYPEEYEHGRLVSTLTWISGIAGAKPGIAIKEAAEVGQPSYSQGYTAVVPFTDRARTAQVGLNDCVPAGCYKNVIVVDEFNQEEPGAVDHKYYAPGVGYSRKTSNNGPTTSDDKLQLTTVSQLDQAGQAAARAAALKLDASARQHSREAYAQSSPIETPPGT